MPNKMTTEQGTKYSMEQIGVEETKRELVNRIATAPKATIIHVHNYEAKNNFGEVANYFYLKGVDYGKMKERSLNLLNEISDNPNFQISATRGVWKSDNTINATINPTNRKSKTFPVFGTIRKTYSHTANEDILLQAIAKVRESIENPREATTDYDKQGNGIYEYDNTLHIRDCQLIFKGVVKQGDYPNKATGEVNAVANAIRRMLPIGKYRQVRLDGRFDYISIGGQLIMQDETGNKNYVALAEDKGVIEPRIAGLEVEQVMERTAVTETEEV